MQRFSIEYKRTLSKNFQSVSLGVGILGSSIQTTESDGTIPLSRANRLMKFLVHSDIKGSYKSSEANLFAADYLTLFGEPLEAYLQGMALEKE